MALVGFSNTRIVSGDPHWIRSRMVRRSRTRVVSVMPDVEIYRLEAEKIVKVF